LAWLDFALLLCLRFTLELHVGLRKGKVHENATFEMQHGKNDKPAHTNTVVRFS